MIEDAGLQRIAGIVRRRRLAVGLTTASALAAGWVVVARIPAEYEARVILRIDDPRPSREYVPPTLNEPAGERLKSRRLSFLARPLVEAAADAAGLLPPAGAGKARREQALADLAARLDARQEGEDTFVVTFTHPDRERARALLAALAAQYAEARAQEMAERARATAALFDREVAALRPRLAEAEAALEQFRLKHYGELPDQLDANLRLLDEVQMRIHSLVGSLDASRARRRAILAEAASPLRVQEEDVARRLSAARARYTPGSAEVRSLEAELERVRTEREADEADLSRRVRGRRELEAAEAEIRRTEEWLEALRSRERELVERVEAAGRHTDGLARLVVDRDVLRERLKNLLARQQDAWIAAQLETDVAARARVTVVEPAWATTQPVRPSKPLLAMIALAVAAGLGIVVGLLLDSMDGRVREPKEVRALLGDAPILGAIPPLGRPERRRAAPTRGEPVATPEGPT